MAASLDGIVQDPSQIEGKRTGILEIKCPYSGRTMTPEAASQEINRFCSTLNNGQVTLKKKHNYHYQVQGQLAITELPWCDFIVWTPQGMSVQRIERDENFWKLMYPKLESFYKEYLLPELADHVYYSGQSIRHLQLPINSVTFVVTILNIVIILFIYSLFNTITFTYPTQIKLLSMAKEMAF